MNHLIYVYITFENNERFDLELFYASHFTKTKSFTLWLSFCHTQSCLLLKSNSQHLELNLLSLTHHILNVGHL